MDKIISTRIDNSVIQRIGMLARQKSLNNEPVGFEWGDIKIRKSSFDTMSADIFSINSIKLAC